MADLTLATTIPGATQKTPPLSDPARTILSLDLGTTTGWAVRGFDGLITSGTASFKPGRYDGGGMRTCGSPTGSPRLTGSLVRLRRSGLRKCADTQAPMQPMSTAV